MPESNAVEPVETSNQIDEEEEIPASSNKAEVVAGEQITDLKQASNDTSVKYHQWLDAKLQQSLEWFELCPSEDHQTLS